MALFLGGNKKLNSTLTKLSASVDRSTQSQVMLSTNMASLNSILGTVFKRPPPPAAVQVKKETVKGKVRQKSRELKRMAKSVLTIERSVGGIKRSLFGMAKQGLKILGKLAILATGFVLLKRLFVNVFQGKLTKGQVLEQAMRKRMGIPEREIKTGISGIGLGLGAAGAALIATALMNPLKILFGATGLAGKAFAGIASLLSTVAGPLLSLAPLLAAGGLGYIIGRDINEYLAPTIQKLGGKYLGIDKGAPGESSAVPTADTSVADLQADIAKQQAWLRTGGYKQRAKVMAAQHRIRTNQKYLDKKPEVESDGGPMLAPAPIMRGGGGIGGTTIAFPPDAMAMIAEANAVGIEMGMARVSDKISAELDPRVSRARGEANAAN